MIRASGLYARALAGLSRQPVHVTFFVTGRCPLKCQTCFYAHHVNEGGEELSLDEIRQLAPSLRGVLWLAITGGEPFARDDLADILEVVARDVRPPYLTLVTSGSFPDRIEPAVARVMSGPRKQPLRVSVSIDGVGELHDEIRGAPGSFDRACETLRILSSLRSRFGRLQLLVCTCYSALNQHQIEEIRSFLDERFRGVPWDFSLVRGEPRAPEAMQGLDIGRYFQLKRKFAQSQVADGKPSPLERLIAAKNQTMIGVQEDAVARSVMSTPCRAGSLSVVIREHGEVVACEIEEFPMGNLRDYGLDMTRLWRGEQSRGVRRSIESGSCVCGHECNITTNMFFHWPSLLKLTGGLWRA